MASSSILPHSRSKPSAKRAKDEELKGLLAGIDDSDNHHTSSESPPTYSESWPSTRTAIIAIIFLFGIVIGGIFALSFFYTTPKGAHPDLDFQGHALRSNGTHNFKRTLVIVSIDGLRADYLDRGLTPHLLAISKKGLRAKFMKPIFPTLTFPNHWALMTGLYAESHGIVANNFWDPATQSEFHYNRVSSTWNPSWWFGEPMWETAEKVGIKTANLMWPGPPKTSSGASPTYFVPWADKVPLKDKHDQLMAWIDLPFDERPQLLMGYEPSLDQAGHRSGPMSADVNQTLHAVDVFAKDLHDSLALRNLTDIVDIVFTSDHGMAETSHPDLVFLDDILGDDYGKIEHEDGWPSKGLRFSSSVNITHSMDVLLRAADVNSEKFDVFTHETMPERYHFSNNERIAPIYVVPKIGYALTDHKDGDDGMTKGNHGYDNDEPPMYAMFVAHGPFSAVTKAVHQSNSRQIFSRSLSRPNKGWHSTSDDTYVMNGFQNVEIYNLVMKLLGIENKAPTNGTDKFWDIYF
jgi:predicted AlkP superfamily pyrophosphatase or phosphodiesterase